MSNPVEWSALLHCAAHRGSRELLPLYQMYPALPPLPPGGGVLQSSARTEWSRGEKVETFGEVMVKLWRSYGKLGLPKCLDEALNTRRHLNNFA